MYETQLWMDIVQEKAAPCIALMASHIYHSFKLLARQCYSHMAWITNDL